LGEFHRYLDDWDALYGVSTHAHGMYQMEFYRQVRERVAAGSTVLSGICGDWFSGAVAESRMKAVVDSRDDILALLRVGSVMCADSAHSRFRSRRLGAQRLLESEASMWGGGLPRLLGIVRNRVGFLSYLLRVPSTLGFVSHGPFLDPEVALRMLTLPDELRHKRQWEREVFARNGLDLDAVPPLADLRNTLNFQAMRRVPLEPLDAQLLREVVDPEYVHWVNRTVGRAGLPWELYWRLGWTPGFRRTVKALRRAGLTERRLAAYGAYLTLRPIQLLLRRRDAARGGGA
jgi:hypothetical protein